MKFGVQVNLYRVPWQDIVASVRTMEEGLWNSIWFADHHIPPGGGGDDIEESKNAFEGLTTIAAVAGAVVTPTDLISGGLACFRSVASAAAAPWAFPGGIGPANCSLELL